MSRAKGPRLVIKRYASGERYWIIRDRTDERGTGCSEGHLADAEKQLAAYIAKKYAPETRARSLREVLIADVITLYVKEVMPHVANPSFIAYTAEPVLEWWGAKTLADVRGRTCREYVEWRIRQSIKHRKKARKVSNQTARHELKTLRAAINHYHREYGPLDAVPAVTLPERSQPKDRWLTRSECALFLWACRRTEHLRRWFLLTLYTGSRKQVVLPMTWTVNLNAGWIDLEAGIIHRRGARERATDKQRPPCRIHRKLRGFLRRWQAADAGRGWAHVCRWQGKPVGDIDKSFLTTRLRAGLDDKVTPHTLRHTMCTWLAQSGVPASEAAGYVGMSLETYARHYLHSSPDHQKRAAGD